jgi:hypothetical protein
MISTTAGDLHRTTTALVVFVACWQPVVCASGAAVGMARGSHRGAILQSTWGCLVILSTLVLAKIWPAAGIQSMHAQDSIALYHEKTGQNYFLNRFPQE